MSKPDCEICCGRGKIRVPIFARISLAALDASPTSMCDSHREYACPECSETVPIERIAVFAEPQFANSTPENDPRYIESIKYSMVRELAGTLLERNLVKFERGPTDDYRMRFAMRMTVGVVSPTVVATLQERVEEHQTTLAREVMAEAARSINHWGSHYNTGGLAKSQAVDSVNRALKTVLDGREKWRAA